MSKRTATLDQLAALAQKAGKKEPTGSKSAEARETVLLDDTAAPEVAAAAQTLLAALHTAKVIEAQKTAALAVVLPWLKGQVLARWAARGRKGESPRVLVGQAGSFTFVCSDTCAKFRLKPGADGEVPTMSQHLAAAGVPANLVALLEDGREWSDETVLSIDVDGVRQERPDIFDRLVAMLAAANRGGLVDNDGKRHRISDADLSVLVRSEQRVTVTEGFLSRAPGHARATAAPGIAGEADAAGRLEALLWAIPPGWSITAPVCADPDAAALGLIQKRTK